MTRSYRPANGSEGDWFTCKFCERCRHYGERPDLGVKGCDFDIDLKSMIFDIDEPGYPPEWVYDDRNRPTCRAFEVPGDVGPSPIRPLPGQLELFPDIVPAPEAS